MATRRTNAAKVDVSTANGSPAPTSPPSIPTTGGTPPLDSPPASHHAFLPTFLELLLLSIYPATLLLGSLFSILHPGTRHATYLPDTQAYDVADAPSYFAKKGNFFNVYFVKIGWFWITLAFFSLVLSHGSMGPGLRPTVTRRRVQAGLRYACITAVWFAVTQWFFGPAIIDRSFRWTGGKCQQIMRDTEGSIVRATETADSVGKQFEQALTHAACKTIGGQWKGGHDISGHVFLLILGSAMLWLELLPLVFRMAGLGEARQVRTSEGLVRSATGELREQKTTAGDVDNLRQVEQDAPPSIGVKIALAVAGASWWMLLMTAAYFHTWFEKFTGLLVAFGAIYAVYFLPRAVPAWRNVVGTPGI